jgi:hypothetical protein
MSYPKTFVYFVRCGDFVKIGSSQWPEYRMKFLQVASPLPMTMIAKFPGYLGHELNAHRQVKQHRHRGEWFHWHPDVEALIAKFRLASEAADANASAA